MDPGSAASFCLHQGTENNMTASAIIENLLLIAIPAVLVISALLDMVLICFENKAKWIKRELESLEALIKDYDQLVEEGNKVESQARRFWESELDLAGIHLQLSEAENNWLKLVREVAREAKDCVSNYGKQRGGVFYGYTALFRLMPIIDVVRQIDAIKSKMLNQLRKKDEDAKNIYKSMESSRSKNRILLDQYTIQENGKSVQPPPAQLQKRRKPSTSIDELMKKGKDLFSGMEERLSIYMLLPLHAFLKDLSQLQLETETEKSWKREAEELIAEAEVHIGNFSFWVSIFSSIRLLKNNIPIVTTRFRKGMNCIFTAFDELLERKNKFDFIDRAGKKSIFPSAYQNTDDTAITSALESIRSKLERRSEQANEINSLCDALKKMHNELQRREETMGRNACLDQIKSMAQEVDHSFHNFLESYMNEHELNRPEQIRKAMKRLQQITKVCNIKRKESTSVVGLENDIRKLVSKLITNSDNNNNQILPIVGMMGVGKTTLAKAIYFNKTVVKHFPIRVLVTVNQRAVLKAQVLLMKEDGTKDQTLYVTQVRDHLKEKPGLVILDNVSKTEDLDTLNKFLSGITNGSRIVLTTRFKNVALHAGRSSTPHQIRLLTKDESWALFQRVTLEPKLESEVEKLARKVVGRCGGLPLAILSLGCLLLANGVTERNLH